MDPNQTPHNAASDLGPRCLLSPICPYTYGKYDAVVMLSFTFFNTTFDTPFDSVTRRPAFIGLLTSHKMQEQFKEERTCLKV